LTQLGVAVERQLSYDSGKSVQITERVCKFGTDRSLLGIYAEPREELPDAALPTVILLNAGLLHHVGQNRLNVTLGRRLAEIGHPSFRFDFSGLGDSLVQRSALSVQERNVAEVREAMDFLQQTRGADRFVLIGLCTGADTAHRSAVADERVCGIVMLDGYSYITLRYFVRRFGKKLLNPVHWKDFLMYKVRNWRRQKTDSSNDGVSSKSYFWVLPKKSAALQEVRGLVDRGVWQMQVFSGSNIGYNYAGQYADSMRDIDFRGLLRVDYAEQSDHTHSRLGERTNLIANIADWLQSCFRNEARRNA
jgi:hypothetical protein